MAYSDVNPIGAPWTDNGVDLLSDLVEPDAPVVGAGLPGTAAPVGVPDPAAADKYKRQLEKMAQEEQTGIVEVPDPVSGRPRRKPYSELTPQEQADRDRRVSEAFMGISSLMTPLVGIAEAIATKGKSSAATQAMSEAYPLIQQAYQQRQGDIASRLKAQQDEEARQRQLGLAETKAEQAADIAAAKEARAAEEFGREREIMEAFTALGKPEWMSDEEWALAQLMDPEKAFGPIMTARMKKEAADAKAKEATEVPLNAGEEKNFTDIFGMASLAWAQANPDQARKQIMAYTSGVGKARAGAATSEYYRQEGETRKVEREKEAAKTKAVREAEEAAREAKTNLNKVENLFTNLWHQKSLQLGKTGAGLVMGGLKKGAAALQAPGGEATARYQGQVDETAIALNRILTGQNRVVKSIYDRIRRTLPTDIDKYEYAWPKIEQSVANSYGLIKAVQADADLMRKMAAASDEELEDPNSAINLQINTIGEGAAYLTPDDRAQIDKILARIKKGLPEASPPKEAPDAGLPVVKTKEDYDKLDPGDEYIEQDENGNVIGTFKKPGGK